MDVTPDRKLVLSPAEAGRLMNRGANGVRDALNAGELKGYRSGAAGRWRIPRAALDEYIQQQLGETLGH